MTRTVPHSDIALVFDRPRMAKDEDFKAGIEDLARQQEAERAARARRSEEDQRNEADLAARRVSVEKLRECWQRWPAACEAYRDSPSQAEGLVDLLIQMSQYIEHIMPGTVERRARECKGEANEVARTFLQLLGVVHRDGANKVVKTLEGVQPRPDFTDANELADRIVSVAHLNPYNGIEFTPHREDFGWHDEDSSDDALNGFVSSEERDAARWLYEREQQRNRSPDITNESIKIEFKKVCYEKGWKFASTRATQLNLIRRYCRAFGLDEPAKNVPGRKQN